MSAVLGSSGSTMPDSLTAEELAEAAGMPLAKAIRLLPVAVALVERFAPGAPQAIKNEATVRCAAWLNQLPTALAKIAVGSIDLEFQRPAVRGALLHSGAQALLSPWKVRRAGAIG